jgi:hypothetical protein
MGYEVHIYRKTNWDIDEPSDISLDEWLSYIESDSEIELEHPNTENPNQVSGFCYWINSPDPEPGNPPWFNYGHGHISTKWTDQSTISKMVEIANKLNARVMGDEGEFYNDLGLVDMKNLPKGLQSKEQKLWWKFWRQ